MAIEVPVEKSDLDDGLCTTGMYLAALVGVLIIIAAITHKRKGNVKEY